MTNDGRRPVRAAAPMGGVRDGNSRRRDDEARGTSDGGGPLASSCNVRATLIPFWGWLIEGSCGERLELGVCEVLELELVPAGACDDFKARVMAGFAAGGPRHLGTQEAFTGIRDDGQFGLGPRPNADPWSEDDTRASLERTAAAYEGPLYPDEDA